jgi:hypothetical protein
MRQFEVLTSGVSRSDGCLQPTQFGAALVRTASVYFPGDLDIVGVKVNRLGFGVTSFKESVQRIANLIEAPVGKYEAL